MSKFKVFNDKDSEKEVLLKLVQDGEGDATLIVVNKDGTFSPYGNRLLWINDLGQIILCEDVNRAFGFSLDDKGRIRVEIE